MFLLKQYLVIALGGALGSMLRFAVGSWIDNAMAGKASVIFPWGTIVVNITGCFVIGFIAGISTPGMERALIGPLGRSFIMIGILGGYTTFSSFSLQALSLAQDNQWGAAAANVIISVVLCLVGVWLGSLAAGAFTQSR